MMKPLWTNHWPTALVAPGVLLCVLVYLAACTPPYAPGSRATSPTAIALADADIQATQAVATIDAALLQTATAVLTPTVTLTPLPPRTNNEEQGEATATPPVQVVTPIIAILILPTLIAEKPAEEKALTATPTPDYVATARANEQQMATALAATLTAQPNREATATAEMQRVIVAVSAILTAQPTSTTTATATPDLTATEVALTQRLATALAATLTAQPTVTPTSTETWTPTATPDLAATETALAQALATAVAATLTAQPTATPTATPLPTATWTPLPTATPTPDFKPLLVDYRRAERAALQSLDPNVLAQLPIFASGEALAAINQQAETLRAAGQYQILLVEELQIIQVTFGATIGVLTQERHTAQTFARTADGDRLVAQETATLQVVYGIVNEEGRWKIERVRKVPTS